MIVLDVNLLIYAYDTTCPDHSAARAWIEEIFSGIEPIGIPWQTLSAFLRVLTYPGTLGERFTMKHALSIVDGWLELPQIRALSPGERHWDLFRELLLKADVRGKLTSDAALAALAIEYGGVLYSADRDFARFPGLRWVNPLQA
jgi:toxin-antitoxin system PIN domain toxin